MRLIMILLFTTACRTETIDNPEEKIIDDSEMDGFSVEDDCEDEDNNSAVHPE